jgi:hypothetical protein
VVAKTFEPYLRFYGFPDAMPKTKAYCVRSSKDTQWRMAIDIASSRCVKDNWNQNFVFYAYESYRPGTAPFCIRQSTSTSDVVRQYLEMGKTDCNSDGWKTVGVFYAFMQPGNPDGIQVGNGGSAVTPIRNDDEDSQDVRDLKQLQGDEASEQEGEEASESDEREGEEGADEEEEESGKTLTQQKLENFNKGVAEANAKIQGSATPVRFSSRRHPASPPHPMGYQHRFHEKPRHMPAAPPVPHYRGREMSQVERANRDAETWKQQMQRIPGNRVQGERQVIPLR